jgi:2'-5' RNA ligase
VVTARLFCALELPDEARRALGEQVERLRRHGADVRWVRPEAMHVTLKFLGDTERELVPRVAAALRATPRPGPLVLRLEGLGWFPKRGRPRVYWAGLAGARERVASLAAAIDDVLAPLGFPREQRAFAAHVTLGRVKGPRGLATLSRACTAESGTLDVELPAIDAFTLFESELRPDGSGYTALERVPLG